MAFSGVPAGALEAERGFRAEYRVSYFGLKVASSSFTSRFSGDTFLLKGSIRSAGIARLFDSTTAETRVSGRIEGDRVEPLEYVLNYTYGGRQKMTAIRFADGKAVETENRPQVTRRGKKWVPLGPEDLSAVFDPITATIIRARSPAEVCNRTIRAYDGEIRVDLKLSYAGTLPFATEGFKGEAVRCRADFEPVAGYRRGREALEYLRRESRIELAFAPVGANDIYALVTARVDTEVGPVHLRATRFAAAD
jgi:hypothetical protein